MESSISEKSEGIHSYPSTSVANDECTVTVEQIPDGTQISSVEEYKSCLTCGIPGATISAFSRVGNTRLETDPLIKMLSYILRISTADIHLYSDAVCISCFKKFENIEKLQYKLTEASREIIRNFNNANRLFKKSKPLTQIEEDQCLLVLNDIDVKTNGSGIVENKILNDIDVKNNGSGIVARALLLANMRKRGKPGGTKPERKYKCNVCGKAFRAYSHRVDHMVTHTLERPFKCDVCGYPTTTKSNLSKHMHQHTKECICSICNKKLSNKFSLKEHMAIHFSEKPFQCEYCEKTFVRYRDKKIHEKGHLREFGSHECKICERPFAIKSRLARHMLIHCKEKQFQCTICDKKFARKDDLKCHERIHTGDKPYSCKECGKQFRYISNCSNHMKTHTKAAKMYRCISCNISFHTEAKYSNHLKTRNHKKKLSDATSTEHICCDRCKTLFTFADYALHRPVCGKKKMKEEGQKEQLYGSCSICCMSFDTFDQFSEHTLHAHVQQGVLSQNAESGVIISVGNDTDIVGLTPLDQFAVTGDSVNMVVSVNNEDTSLQIPVIQSASSSTVIPLNLDSKSTTIVSGDGLSSNVLTEISHTDSIIDTGSVVEPLDDPSVSTSSTVTMRNPEGIFKISEWNINPYCQK